MRKNTKMTTPHSQDLQEIVDVFKKSYAAPTKAILWTKAIEQWAGFVIGGLLILFVILLAFLSSPRTPYIDSLPKDQQVVLSHLRRIIKFMDLTKRSVNERQELYADLMHTVSRYANRSLRQEDIQNKLGTLISSLNICKTTRRIYMRRFSSIGDPLTNPETAAAYAAMSSSINVLPEHKASPITAKSEQEQWDVLCKLCANEVQKTQSELAQLITAQAQ